MSLYFPISAYDSAQEDATSFHYGSPPDSWRQLSKTLPKVSSSKSLILWPTFWSHSTGNSPGGWFTLGCCLSVSTPQKSPHQRWELNTAPAGAPTLRWLFGSRDTLLLGAAWILLYILPGTVLLCLVPHIRAFCYNLYRIYLILFLVQLILLA